MGKKHKKTLRDKRIAKEVEYYSHLVGQWFENRMEATKFFINVSAGAIGLQITLLTLIKPTQLDNFLIFLYTIALLGFLSSMIISGYSFYANTEYLEELKAYDEGSQDHPPRNIKWIDLTTAITFYVSLFLLVIFFLFYLINNFVK